MLKGAAGRAGFGWPDRGGAAGSPLKDKRGAADTLGELLQRAKAAEANRAGEPLMEHLGFILFYLVAIIVLVLHFNGTLEEYGIEWLLFVLALAAVGYPLGKMLHLI